MKRLLFESGKHLGTTEGTTVLVLKRGKGQSIRIGSNVIIHVLQSKGGHVTIGIEAPLEVQAWRAELDRQKGLDGTPIAPIV